LRLFIENASLRNKLKNSFLMKPSCRDELFYDDQFKTETEELLVGQKVTGKSSQIQITFKTRRYEVLMNTKL